MSSFGVIALFLVVVLCSPKCELSSLLYMLFALILAGLFIIYSAKTRLITDFGVVGDANPCASKDLSSLLFPPSTKRFLLDRGLL